MFSALLPFDNLFIEFAAIPLIFLALYAAGRWLKRRQRVELGVLYVLFCLSMAIWLPLSLRDVFPGLGIWRRDEVVKHLGAVTLFLGVFVFLALVRRYFWEEIGRASCRERVYSSV